MNAGAGRVEDAYLLVAPGIPVAVVSVKPNNNGTDLEPEADDAYMRNVL